MQFTLIKTEINFGQRRRSVSTHCWNISFRCIACRCLTSPKEVQIPGMLHCSSGKQIHCVIWMWCSQLHTYLA